MNPVVVVGAGPAGLALGACLREAAVPTILLERSESVASSWRHHYDRLHLHTDRRISSLPYLPLPAGSPRYVSRDQFVAYLESYAERFGLDIRLGQDVTSVAREDDGWRVVTPPRTYASDTVVVATGNARVPRAPAWPGVDAYRGTVIHSSQYVNGSGFAGQRVLVVGFGNSAGEIAIDLHEHGASPSLSVRSAVNVIPREILGISSISVSLTQTRLPASVADRLNAPLLRMTIGDITSLGLRKLPYGPSTQVREHGQIPLIDIGTIDLIRSGRIRVRPGIERFTEDGAVFEDGTTETFDAVVLATGYRPRVDEFVEAPDTFDDEGSPLASGTESAAQGLYYCGFHVSPTGMVREAGLEARRIARAIASARGAA
jgi:indole-3-pyruvate monooxygenase